MAQIKKLFNPNEIYFTADPHFGHDNIIKMCKRPFKDMEEMTNQLITNWNAVIPKDGIVFLLGDVALSSTKYIKRILTELHGTKYLIVGNHERTVLRPKHIRDMFEGIYDILEIRVDDKGKHKKYTDLFMCHYPMISWKGSSHGSILLHGHSHGNYKSSNPKILDVGVDVHDYKPLSYWEVKKIILNQISKTRK